MRLYAYCRPVRLLQVVVRDVTFGLFQFSKRQICVFYRESSKSNCFNGICKYVKFIGTKNYRFCVPWTTFCPLQGFKSKMLTYMTVVRKR